MFTEKDIKTGDVFLTRSNEFLSRAIVSEMILFAKKNNIPYEDINVFSHMGTFVWDQNGELRIAESVDNGFQQRLFRKHYKLMTPTQCVLRIKGGYTEEETEEVIRKIYDLDIKSTNYQYQNFIQWPIYIRTKINLFGKSTKSNYCYETTYAILNHMRPAIFPDSKGKVDHWMVYDLNKFDRIF